MPIRRVQNEAITYSLSGKLGRAQPAYPDGVSACTVQEKYRSYGRGTEDYSDEKAAYAASGEPRMQPLIW